MTSDTKEATPVQKLMQKKLGDEFENPNIPKKIRDKCEAMRGVRMDRLELQKKEQELEAEILRYMQDSDNEELKKKGFVLEFDTEVVHFRIDDDPKIKTRKLESREE